MAGDDPTQATRLVQFEVPTPDRTFLQEMITMARDGVREELVGLPAGDPRAAELKREEIAYERLLAGLAGEGLVLDRDVRAAAVELAEVVDASNEYARVAFEHQALGRLVAIVSGGARSSPPDASENPL